MMSQSKKRCALLVAIAILGSGGVLVAQEPGPLVIDEEGNATFSGDVKASGTISGIGAVPPGTIVLWGGSKAAIPAGWVLWGDKTSPEGVPYICGVSAEGACASRTSKMAR